MDRMVDDLISNWPQGSCLPTVVTGADGYLGRELVSELRDRGQPVLRVVRKQTGQKNDVVIDLREPDTLTRTLASVPISHIVHAAAVVPKEGTGYDDAAAAEENTLIARNAISFASSKNVPLILISSMTVYPMGARGPVREDSVTGPSSSVYAHAKRQAEEICENSSVTGFAVRIPGLFGVERTDGLVANIRRTLQSGDVPVLPQQPVQWAAMHVRDAATAISNLCNVRATNFMPVNVGYEGPISISRFYTMACQIYGRDPNYVVDHPDFEFDLHRWKSLTGQTAKSYRDAFEGYLN
ncbi:MAG: NAD-dependent epimerase/dehydratase family protein [Pseudomonadota bacterium]